MSPLSVLIVLAFTRLGAKGDTALELSKGLHLPRTPERVGEAFKALLPKLKGNEYYSLISANKVYIKDGVPINKEFVRQSQEMFDAELENINFEDKVKAAETINKWVEHETNAKIKNFIQPDKLDGLIKMILVNAVYFKAKWSFMFDKMETSKRKFYKSVKEEIAVDTMQQLKKLRFAENRELDAIFVELPYKDSDVIFTIVLPNKKEGLYTLENHMENVLSPQNYTSQGIKLFMPKFKFDGSFNLVKHLKNLGIRKPFSDGDADFSGLLANQDKLSISNVVQKSFISVDEKGTEAAAVTGVQIYDTSFSQVFVKKIIEVDHPFLFIIGTEDVGPIFIGRVKIPSL